MRTGADLYGASGRGIALKSCRVRIGAKGVNGSAMDDINEWVSVNHAGVVWLDDVVLSETDSTARELAARGGPQGLPPLEGASRERPLTGVGSANEQEATIGGSRCHDHADHRAPQHVPGSLLHDRAQRSKCHGSHGYMHARPATPTGAQVCPSAQEESPSHWQLAAVHPHREPAAASVPKTAIQASTLDGLQRGPVARPLINPSRCTIHMVDARPPGRKRTP